MSMSWSLNSSDFLDDGEGKESLDIPIVSLVDGSSEVIPREHPLYLNAMTGLDGLYHCPWEGRYPSCNHKPEKLKCNYEYVINPLV